MTTTISSLAFVAVRKSNPRRRQNLLIKPTLFLLVITSFLLLEYGITSISTRSRSNIYIVHAFDIHQSRGRHYPPPRSTTATEPYTETIFPKTSTPADLEEENDGMFSPMHQNEKRKKKRKQKTRSQVKKIKSIWDSSSPVLVQSSSLKTFNFETPTVERVQILLKKADMVDRSGRRIPNQEPLIARVDLWHGPDSTPQNLAIYHDDVDDDDDEFDELDSADCDYDNDDDENENHAASYSDTPFSTIIETPQGHNTIAIRNIADSSDLMACVEGEKNKRLEEEYWSGRSSTSTSRNQNGNDGSNTSNDSPLQSVIQRLQATTTPQRIDSSLSSRGSVTDASDGMDDEDKPSAVVGSIAVELPDNIASVQVLLQTEYMRPLQARIELELRMIEEDGNYRVIKRTIVEVYSEDGMHRPFFAVLETPRKNNRKTRRRGQKGKGSAVYSTSMCVVNLSSAEFPLFATVEPHLIDPFRSDEEEDDIMNSREKNPVEEDEDERASGHQRFTHFGGGSSSILDAEVL